MEKDRIWICFLFSKLQTHLMGLETTNSPSTSLLEGEEVPFEVELIGKFWK